LSFKIQSLFHSHMQKVLIFGSRKTHLEQRCAKTEQTIIFRRIERTMEVAQFF
jgi:hypothetical protein